MKFRFQISQKILSDKNFTQKFPQVKNRTITQKSMFLKTWGKIEIWVNWILVGKSKFCFKKLRAVTNWNYLRYGQYSIFFEKWKFRWRILDLMDKRKFWWKIIILANTISDKYKLYKFTYVAFYYYVKFWTKIEILGNNRNFG